MFPEPEGDLVTPRRPGTVTDNFKYRVQKLGFKLRFHDLRGTHVTLLITAGIPVHVVAKRCGHDPAVMMRAYAKRTDEADAQAATVIGSISKTILGS
jgi:integrase